MTSRSVVRAITAVAIVVAGAVAVTGCTGPGRHTDPTAAASAGGTARSAPIGRRVDVPCSTLVPDTVLATYRRTFTLDPSARPARGSAAAGIAAQRGDVCIWVDQADHVRLTLAVASLPQATLTKLEDTLYQDSNSVPTYTVEGYFEVHGGLGRADAFPGRYWLHAESTVFGEPGDAQPVLDAARAALVPGGATGTATTGGATGTATPSGSATPSGTSATGGAASPSGSPTP